MIRNIRWRAIWEAFVSVVTVATCLYVVVTAETQRVRAVQSGRVPVGTVLTPGSRVAFDGSDLTVLIGMSSTCHYCEESLPAFRELTSTLAHRAESVRTVALTLEPAERLSAYLATNNLGHIQAVSV